MVHLPISLTAVVVALNIIASIAAPVVQDGELDARSLEPRRSKNRAKKSSSSTTPHLPKSEPVKVEAPKPPSGKTGMGDKLKKGAKGALNQLEQHPNTLQAGTDIISNYVGSRGSSN